MTLGKRSWTKIVVVLKNLNVRVERASKLYGPANSPFSASLGKPWMSRKEISSSSIAQISILACYSADKLLFGEYKHQNQGFILILLSLLFGIVYHNILSFIFSERKKNQTCWTLVF